MTPAYNCLTFDTTLNAELLDSLLDVNTTLTLGTALIHSALLLTLAFILNVGITPVRKFTGLSPNARLIDCRSRIHSLIHSFICPCSPRTAVFSGLHQPLGFLLGYLFA